MTSLTHLETFLKFLQGCTIPIVMISGVGLILLTITNRMGRVVDRIRFLVADLQKIEEAKIIDRGIKIEEIRIFYRRAEILKNSIAWILISMISSCLMIPAIFIMSVGNLDLRFLGYLFLIGSVTGMFIGFKYFFKDITMSLAAIKMETASIYDLHHDDDKHN